MRGNTINFHTYLIKFIEFSEEEEIKELINIHMVRNKGPASTEKFVESFFPAGVQAMHTYPPVDAPLNT